jgi:hypothetical protein
VSRALLHSHEGEHGGWGEWVGWSYGRTMTVVVNMCAGGQGGRVCADGLIAQGVGGSNCVSQGVVWY